MFEDAHLGGLAAPASIAQVADAVEAMDVQDAAQGTLFTQVDG
jgi:hypothetical protein